MYTYKLPKNPVRKALAIGIMMQAIYIFVNIVFSNDPSANLMNFAQFYLLLIICTSGIGLIPLLMGTIVTGFVPLIVWSLFFPSKDIPKTRSNTISIPLEKINIIPEQLLTYVVEAKKFGAPKDDVKLRLAGAGWKENQIQTALDTVYTQ